jgi:tetratricopeptide (TPR) repeat protein
VIRLTSGPTSGNNQGIRERLETNLLEVAERILFHSADKPRKYVCLAVFLLSCGTLAPWAQTFEVGGPDKNQPSHSRQKSQQHSPSSDSSLGWGSSIEVAREARAAREALQRSQNREAAAHAAKAAKAAPQNPDLWFLYAYAARLAGDYQASVDAYTRGLQARPSSIEGLSGLAQTYARMGRSKEAEETLRRVLAANPSSEADLRLAGELALNTDPKLALTYLSRADAIHPSARTELVMARAYQRAGDRDKARDLLERARSRAPHDPDIVRSVAAYYRDTGQYDQAISTLQTLPSDAPAYLSELGYTYELAGKRTEAADTFLKAANAAPNEVELQLSAAQAQVNAKRPTRAEPLLRRVENSAPNHYRLHAIRGALARSSHENSIAIREYQAAVSSLPAAVAEGVLYPIALRLELAQLYREAGQREESDSQAETARSALNQLDVQGLERPEFLRLKAASAIDSGDYEEAEADLQEALKLQPSNVNILLNYGNFLRSTKRPDEASKQYLKVLDLDQQNAPALESLGYLARESGDPKAAGDYFNKLNRVAPNDYVGYLALGDLSTDIRDFANAQTNYERAYSLAKDNPLVIARAMNAALENHQAATARHWLDRATEAQKSNPEVMREHERYLTITGKYQESAKLGYQVIQRLPRDPEAPVYLAYDLLFMNRYDEAMEIVRRFEPVLPKDKDLPLVAGYVYAHNGQKQDAIKAFTRALELDPNMATGYMNRGYVWNDMRMATNAVQDFRKAISLRPDYGEAHLGLSYSLLQMRRPQAALQEAELAEKSLGQSGTVHLARAEAYRQRSTFERAEDEYQRALKMQPGDANIYMALADTQFRQREYPASIESLQKAISIAPANHLASAQLARSYAMLGDAASTAQAIAKAESGEGVSDYRVLLANAGALQILGQHDQAMDRYSRALDLSNADRLHVRLALGRFFAQQHKASDAQQQVSLGFAEARVSDPDVVTTEDYLEAADILMSINQFPLAQQLFVRAQALGADDVTVAVGVANASLAMGNTNDADAALSSVEAMDDGEAKQNYAYIVARGNVYRQRGDSFHALSAFARANEIDPEDPVARNAEFELSEDEGRQITQNLAVGSQFHVAPIFEDANIYQLDARLRGFQNGGLLLPPPRHSVETFADARYHLHIGDLPTISGFIGERNANGTISIPSQLLIQKRNTLDTIFNFGVTPVLRLGNLRFNVTPGLQFTLRRDTVDPVDMNQNLFRQFLYVSSSPIGNWLSFSGNVIREAGPFTEQTLHSRDFSGTLEFRVGRPWSKTAFLTGYTGRDLLFRPAIHEYFTTSTYAGVEQHFGERFRVTAIGEYLRAWRVEGTEFAIAQTMRPNFALEAKVNQHWSISAGGLWSRGEAFHSYDSVDSRFLVSYVREMRARRTDGVQSASVSYPMRFSFGFQQQTFYDFPGHSHTSIVPVVSFTLF